MAIGVVKNFNKDKGFGFINMEGEERDTQWYYEGMVRWEAIHVEHLCEDKVCIFVEEQGEGGEKGS